MKRLMLVWVMILCLMLAQLACVAPATGEESLPDESAPNAEATQGDEEPEQEAMQYSPASDYVIGNTVVFGQYEQDNDTENGQEPIEWLVLDTDEENHRALVISCLCLDVKQFHSRTGYASWEECTLRAWLNGDFLNTAFTPEEQAAILYTEVDNSLAQGNPKGEYKKNLPNTMDRIYALSYAEANLYFGSNEARKCTATDYAYANGLQKGRDNHKVDDKPAATWLLRSPGRDRMTVYTVTGGGNLLWENIYERSHGVRPVFWIDLDSELLENPEVEPQVGLEADIPGPALKAGDSVLFGVWEQDNDKRNGDEAIEWTVLDVQDGKALLITRYGLIKCRFANNNRGQTWSDSELRGTLNSDFFKNAFTPEEQDAILVTLVDDGKEQHDPNHPSERLGENTKDRIFALSYAEAVQYFPTDEERRCPATQYIRIHANHSRVAADEESTCWYWLRSPAFSNNACAVNWDGTIDSAYISHPYGVARPCCWVDVNRLMQVIPERDEQDGESDSPVQDDAG